MSGTTQIPKAVLKMPLKIGDQIIRVTDIRGKLTNNTYFPTGWVASGLSQTQFNADVQAFLDAETAVKAKTPGAVGQREQAFTTLKDDLGLVITMVQAKVKANPTNAAAIINGAGFFVRTGGGSRKKHNDAYNTQIPGIVVLTSDTPGPHEWEMSKDMTNITKLPATTTSKTKVTGLTYGDTWYFRNKKTDTKKKTYNYCSWILLKIGAGGRNLGGGTIGGTAGNLPTA
jgi:hypothetical protein